jgi:hypothetical protein
MLNYLKKFALEILPSVAATVIGAYIVNHYISKPATDAPVAAVTAPADAKKAKPADDVASAPQPGVKAKGISERGMIEKAASEQPGEFKPSDTKAAPDTKAADTKAAETKPADSKPAETASAPAEPRRHFWSAPPKAVAKTTPASAASPAAPAETAATTTSAPAEGKDANDLARAAIERLRGSEPKTQEAARTPDVPRVDAPRTVTPAPTTASVIKPLPPPITVAPPVEQAAAQPPYTASVDPNRPVPPAEIPPPPPLDIQADASKLATRTTNMAQDMLRSAKSMFHAVIPGSNSDRQSSSSASQFTD